MFTGPKLNSSQCTFIGALGCDDFLGGACIVISVCSFWLCLCVICVAFSFFYIYIWL